MKKQYSKSIPIIIGITLLISSNLCLGNDMRITGTVFTNTGAGPNTSTVTFNLSWKNSWRTTNAPNNWDAAWIFIKYRTCGAGPTVEWSHASISTVLANHTLGTLEPTTTTTNPDPLFNTIDPSPENKGIMLRRNAVGTYPAAAADVITLRMTDDFGATSIKYDIKVFGIEMVFIPTGSFLIGDGGTSGNTATNGHYYNFMDSIRNDGTVFRWTPMNISSENPKTVMSYQMTNAANGAGGGQVLLGANFPKGYRSFYIMKYEITQDQYAQFLNTLPLAVADKMYPGCYSITLRRQVLNNTGAAPNQYFSTNPNRAQNHIVWHNQAAYLDWSALRVLSELEYEKACRGPLPAMNDQYAWGTSTIYPNNIYPYNNGNGANNSIIISTTIPAEDGSEVALGFVGVSGTPVVNCNWYRCNELPGGVTGGNGYRGPLRVGIFANSTSGGVTSGGTYYGVMEMSGNVAEFYVPASNITNSAGMGSYGVAGTMNNTFVRAWGDGYLDITVPADPMHNVIGWPVGHRDLPGYPPTCDACCVGNGTGYADIYAEVGNGTITCRGGSYSHEWSELRISSRYYTRYTQSIDWRWTGGRGGR